MDTSVENRCWSLTEKEKQTLRLMVRGHDAKSIARSLGLSVHTINERLRDARRKMAASSSREAARMLLEIESNAAGLPTPDLLVDAQIGADERRLGVNQQAAPVSGAGTAYRPPWTIIGVVFMTLALGLFALAALPQVAATPPATPPATQATAEVVQSVEVIDTARHWLGLLDEARWDESYRATGAAFRKLNTAKTWASASDRVRLPLGAMVSRTLVSHENLPAPTSGYEVVKFRTRFANKADAIETVSLEREDGAWRVVGVTIG